MKPIILVALVIGLTSLAARNNAQNPTRIVYIEPGTIKSDFDEQVRSALKARINGTARYALGEADDAEVEVSLVCIDLSQVTKNVSGGVCSYTISYWPHELEGLSCALGPPSLTTANGASNLGEDIFETMVNASTEKELAKHFTVMKEAIARYEKH